MKQLLLVLVLAGGSLTLGCEAGSDDGVFTGPLTVCSYTSVPPDEAIVGRVCTTNEECSPGICLQPGDGGNITNNVFGMCTFSCNCNDDKTLSVESGHPTLSCVIPGGCNSGAGDDRFRHLVLKCNTKSDCPSDYNVCQSTDAGTALGTKCGHLHKVCQAHK